jgi:hypothetical protein
VVSHCHSSYTVNFLSVKFHFTQFPLGPSWSDLDDHVLSSVLLSSVCTIDLPCTLSESFHRCWYLIPNPLPLFVVHTISRSFKRLSACATGSFTDNFLPVVTSCSSYYHLMINDIKYLFWHDIQSLNISIRKSQLQNGK